MTLARQLTLAMLLVVLCAFAVRSVMTIMETRDYLNQQLQSHARDSARSLGLSISLHLADGDKVFSESIVDAMFDSGDYARIEVFDLKGKSELVRTQPSAPNGIPQWFVDWVPLELPTANAELTTGWTRSGHVQVQSHPGYAYSQLWGSTIRSLWSAFGFLIVAMLVFSVVLKFLLRPLWAIESQALAVADRRFPNIGQLPRSRELRRVAEAMNFMTQSVQRIIEDQADQARRLTESAYIDPVTGVRNRRATEMDIAQLVREGVDESTGALILINVDGLDEVNQLRGYEAGDVLVRDAAAIITQHVKGHRASVGRFGGAIFAITVADITHDVVEQFIQQTIETLRELHIDDTKSVQANAGIAFHGAAETVETLIAQCEAALRNAQQNGSGQWHTWKASETVELDALKNEDDLAHMLRDLIADRAIVLEAQPVQCAQGEILHYEILARYRDPSGHLIPAAKFIPMASRLGLSASLDIVIVEQVLDFLAIRFQSQECFAINLSPGAVADVDFVRWLKRRLRREPQERRERLAFEVTEHFAASARPALQSLIEAVQPLGVSIGIDHCGSGDVSMQALRELRLNYAKLYGALIQGLDSDTDKFNLVQSLVSIGHGMGLTMVAEFIENENELASARKAGFDALQGYFIGRPAALD